MTSRMMATLAVGWLIVSPLPWLDEARADDAGTNDVEVSDHGIAHVAAQGSMDKVAERLRSGLEKRGMRLMATIDHTANAEGVDLELPPTKTFIFGKPEVGTLLMQCQGSVALDLPQKMLLREQDGAVIIEWNDPHYLAERHELSGCDLPLDGIAEALSGLAMEAAGQ